VDISRIPRSSFVGRALRAPLSLIPKDAVVPIVQGPLRGKRWIVGSATHGCWLGTYEYRKQRLFAQAVLPGAVVYDVGANVGFYTLLAAERAGPAGRVYAFEPLPRNVTLLRQHLALNRVQTVDVREAAASDASGLASFDGQTGPSIGRLKAGGTLRVPTVRLDDLVFDQGLPPADVIKMDIEGGEFQALHGAQRLLRLRHPLIFLSTHGQRVHADCCALLADLSYGLTAVDQSAAGLGDELMARSSAASGEAF
jgi:FkbM family methyltransferase